jgi:hypothetical protein
MRNRYQKPSPAKLGVYFLDAQQTDNDAQRAEGVKALYALLRRWRAEAQAAEAAAIVCAREQLPEEAEAIQETIEEALQRRRERWVALGAPHGFDRALQAFFERAGRAIFASPDPLAAMRVFWEGAPRLGRPTEVGDGRHFELAVIVEQRRASAGAIDKAVAAVAAETNMPEDTLHKIYYRWRAKVRAAIAAQEIWRQEGLRPEPDPAPDIEDKITPKQFETYSALVDTECPNGMTVEDNLELWSFARRASFL